MPNFSPFSRRENEVRRIEEEAAQTLAMLAENGYRGRFPEDVPTEEKAPVSDGSAHYTSHEQLAAFRATGHPVQALCGRVWTPGRGPEGAPVCPRCDAVYRRLPNGGRQH
jgi:uncharacterized Zn-finger protein